MRPPSLPTHTHTGHTMPPLGPVPPPPGLPPAPRQNPLLPSHTRPPHPEHMPRRHWPPAAPAPATPEPRGFFSRFQEPPLSALPQALPAPRTPSAPAPFPAMASGAAAAPPGPVLAALLFSSLVLAPARAIVVYTDREVHGTVGSKVTLHCSFWSSEWLSEDVSFTWRFQAEGGRDAISIFHYAKGQPYIDEVGVFKERIQWVGDARWKDGSIVIHNLDYGDNGTFTCDVKNPPDIVGKSSQVTLYVFDKVPTRYGLILGAVIGGVLGLVLLLVLLGYLVRYCWLRRRAALQRRLSAMEKGKPHKPSKDSKRGRQTPVLYAMLDHSRLTKSAGDKKSKGTGDSRKDKK
uniref:Myelin protein P0 n=1 Tax=Ornithorhynchus anatinus TaxID=9258 RepID=A0A6I8NBJ2_ORNAN